jgi:streptogramin lyase
MRSRFPTLVFPGALALLSVLGGQAAGQAITEFPLPRSGSSPLRITAGPDGNLWFTEFTYNSSVGRITPAGSVTEFLLPTPFVSPASIATGPDGNLWFTEPDFDLGATALIGRISPAGTVTDFPLPNSLSGPNDITSGPDGNLWFTESNINGNKIGRITTAGVLTEFPIPTAGYPIGIAAGPDGSLWFTEYANKIGRITISGVITEFSIPTAAGVPVGITAGPDGNVWFTESLSNKIGRITTAGVITEFSMPTAGSGLQDIATGPDGNLWFTERFANKIGRITTAGVITEFPIPTAASEPIGITTGPDGNVWFTELRGNKIGRIVIGGAPAVETRILPVVGSTPGAAGTVFKTSVQLHNSTTSVISGRIVFHPSGFSGSTSDPALSYTLSPGQTQSMADLLPAMGRSGLGSADIEATSGSIPAATVRVFNDAGAAGTTGFTEEPLRVENALRPGQLGVLLLPTDLTNFRFNLGVRTLEAGAASMLTLRDASGTILTTVSRALPATYHEQQSASAFLGVSTLPAGGSIEITVGSGAAILYGATVDNRTGDPSLQIARPVP